MSSSSPPSRIKTRNFDVVILIVLVISNGIFQAVRQARNVVPLAATTTTTGMRRKEEGVGVGASQEQQQESAGGAYDDDNKPRRSNNKIAILLSYVPSGMWGNKRRLDDTLLDMVVNQACYAKILGYDLIFNTTNHFGNNTDTIAMAWRNSRTNKTSSTTSRSCFLSLTATIHRYSSTTIDPWASR
jgi:hypothetical protein